MCRESGQGPKFIGQHNKANYVKQLECETNAPKGRIEMPVMPTARWPITLLRRRRVCLQYKQKRSAYQGNNLTIFVIKKAFTDTTKIHEA